MKSFVWRNLMTGAAVATALTALGIGYYMLNSPAQAQTSVPGNTMAPLSQLIPAKAAGGSIINP